MAGRPAAYDGGDAVLLGEGEGEVHAVGPQAAPGREQPYGDLRPEGCGSERHALAEVLRGSGSSSGSCGNALRDVAFITFLDHAECGNFPPLT
ncbi:hypothetical protein SAMN05421505_11452 [Sinosporangium album]|uniref:Uncharacterized protein n=1 Tax=Sinosporangium album TaxID=504805 RepID=A0A1G8BJV7_9ACTN|nr:hypothetical protein [Sinosporangium album]SDH32860.1 hypothetical protein SAMN05421505_11452 [Sinosporangium album]